MLSQMGIAIIFALSYNMLLGQTGMLSFGHAVYYGLGGFTDRACPQRRRRREAADPAAAAAAGRRPGRARSSAWCSATSSTKRAGTPFAMISLGIARAGGRLRAHVPRGFFGGEGGIATNRASARACSASASARRSRSTT